MSEDVRAGILIAAQALVRVSGPYAAESEVEYLGAAQGYVAESKGIVGGLGAKFRPEALNLKFNFSRHTLTPCAPQRNTYTAAVKAAEFLAFSPPCNSLW